MLAMAYLANQKNWIFEYYTKTIPLHVKQIPEGNHKKALDLGMNVFEVPHDQFEQRIRELFLHVNSHEVLVPQGGADPIAQSGVSVLADEIRLWQEANHFKTLNIITPSGTGTTAYYLAKLLPTCKVLSTAVVGDDAYLKTEMKALGDIPENLQLLSTQKRYRFATPYKEYYEIYKELHASGIEFDLVYAPKMWLAFLENIKSFEGDFLYVHSGGVSGNATMLKRYQFKEIL
jgi:1-aminocyclopropane-1-carboxylate deaminase/D-cysteine desulfhydrase-like pyridoxal-dependent ACC family enzyme